MIYHYAVIEKPPAAPTVTDNEKVDMENLDYKRQPAIFALREAVEDNGGVVCGIWRGGLFGLATNQVAVLSEWPTLVSAKQLRLTQPADENRLVDEVLMEPTVRPGSSLTLNRPGFYVLRWLSMRSDDIPIYTGLCLETWPAFESVGNAYCYGVFRECANTSVIKVLMVTWYDSLQAWEETRQLAPDDVEKWAKRSTMELAHWGHAARLVCT